MISHDKKLSITTSPLDFKFPDCHKDWLCSLKYELFRFKELLQMVILKMRQEATQTRRWDYNSPWVAWTNVIKWTDSWMAWPNSPHGCHDWYRSSPHIQADCWATVWACRNADGSLTENRAEGEPLGEKKENETQRVTGRVGNALITALSKVSQAFSVIKKGEREFWRQERSDGMIWIKKEKVTS